MSSLQPEKIGADLRRKVETLLTGQGLGVLATADPDGHPYASLIAFAANAERTEIYFVTPKATRKSANLAHDQRVALLVNNSINQPVDFHEAVAATILGKARLLEGDQREGVLSIYLAKHPYLKQFATSPSCALFAIEVTGVTMVQKFQSVSELSVDDAMDTDR
jgi:nitroimidazol reductase NimA-like FMN-containing flavoprotein (pyridoxamine 5'-phosphate oxidase superfamily)